MIKLESEDILVQLAEGGAEIKSVVTKATGYENMWQADPTIWGRTAPVLFPIVGKLKNNSYSFEGKQYSLPQHGFARDKIFKIISQSENNVVFELRADEEMKKVFPFNFVLQIEFTLNKNILTTNYTVKNSGENEMYFSLGTHPGFVCDFGEEGKSTNVNLVFEKEELAKRYFVEEGLISNRCEVVFHGKQIRLNENLLENDALVFKQLNSKSVKLNSDYNPHPLKFSWEGFPYFGIWKKPDASFICLEPWAGIADGVESTGMLIEKEGIIKLKANEEYKAKLKMEFS